MRRGYFKAPSKKVAKLQPIAPVMRTPTTNQVSYRGRSLEPDAPRPKTHPMLSFSDIAPLYYSIQLHFFQ